MKIVIIKLVVFCVLFLVIITGANTVFFREDSHSQSKSRISAFHRQPEDSIDVMLIGASGIYRGWSSVDAWHNYGFTSWAWSTSSQPFLSIKYIIRDIQNSQSPRLYVINYTNMRITMNYNENTIREVTDNLSHTFNRLDAIHALMPYRQDKNVSFLYYAFPLLRFHANWESILSKGAIGITDTGTKGTLVQDLNFQIEPADIDYQESEEQTELDEIKAAELTELLTWLRDEEIPVLFLQYPRALSSAANSQIDAIEALLDEYGFSYLNLLKESEKIGLDENADFQDPSHVNYWGRTKVTDYLADYLTANYDLPDHRNDPAYDSWDDSYLQYRSMVDSYLLPQ